MIITLYIFQLMNIGYFSTVGGKPYFLSGVIIIAIQSALLISLSLYRLGKIKQDHFEISLLEQGLNPLEEDQVLGHTGKEPLGILSNNDIINQTKDAGLASNLGADNIELSKVNEDKRSAPGSVPKEENQIANKDDISSKTHSI